MPLTDQRIEEIAQTLPMAGCDEQKAGWGQGYTKESGYITPNIISTIYPFARVIEQEVSAPLLERIEEADELARFRLGLAKEWQAVANSLQAKLDALTAPTYEHCGRAECKTCDDQLNFKPAPVSEPTKRDEAYDQIDRFLRNNLDDVDYADYFHALGVLWDSTTQPAECLRCKELETLSVTNIMLAVVPGDGSGFEVYAKSVGDVEAALSKQCDKIDGLQTKVADHRRVLGLAKEAMTWDVGGEPLPTLEMEALAQIEELLK